jgi:hypothetical protein
MFSFSNFYIFVQDGCHTIKDYTVILWSFVRVLLMSLFLRLQMKGFSIGVTTVYINEATTLFLGDWETAEPKYSPRAVP